MCKIKENSWVLYALAGAAFARFPLQYYGYELRTGFILIADSDSDARKLESDLLYLFNGVQITRWNSRAKRPENFRMGIHRYKKKDTEDELETFLYEKKFLPVIVVGGVLPKILYEKGYVIKASFHKKELEEIDKNYELFCNYLMDHIEFVIREIQMLKTSKIMMEYSRQKASAFVCYMLSVARLWWCFWRENGSEEASDQWVEKFMESVIEAEAEMSRFDGFYSVKTAVRDCVVRYVQQNKIPIVPINDGIKKEEAYIGMDEDFYLIPEALLKMMCAPLLETVSFLQLKKEMELDGMLVTNNIPGNYTVKKVLLDVNTGRTQRIRLLKLNKLDLTTDEALYLENLAEFYEETEEEYQ